MSALCSATRRAVTGAGRALELSALTDAGLAELYHGGWGALRRRLRRPAAWFVDEPAFSSEAAPVSPLEAFPISRTIPAASPVMACLHPAAAPATLASSTIACLLYVHQDLRWFAGHFPGRPLLPGVVQIDWAVSQGERLGFGADRFTGWTGVKFPTPLLPETVVGLCLTATAADTLVFVLESRHGIHGRGTLSYRG